MALVGFAGGPCKYVLRYDAISWTVDLNILYFIYRKQI